MKSLLFFAYCLLVFSRTSLAGGGDGSLVGNGGHGFKESKDSVYLLDFYLAGIEKMEMINSNSESVFTDGAPLKLENFSTEGVRQMLEKISYSDPVLAAALFVVIKMHQWKIVDFYNEDRTNDKILLPHEILKKTVQLAIRKGDTIWINKKYFYKLNSFNQLGLIFHEAMSALMQADAKNFNRHFRNSGLVRMLNANLFQNKIDDRIYENVLSSKKLSLNRQRIQSIILNQNAFQIFSSDGIFCNLKFNFESQLVPFSWSYATEISLSGLNSYVELKALVYKTTCARKF